MISRRAAARACVVVGGAGLLTCAALFLLRVRSVASLQAEDQARWEARQTAAGAMVAVPPGPGATAFWLDETEVTVAAYRACLTDGACTPPALTGHCNFGRPDRDDHPVNCVDHGQAEAFCRWAGRRLPTAREWTQILCASFPPASARSSEDGACVARGAVWRHQGPRSTLVSGPRGTCPVTAHPASATPPGLLGLTGNVSEWTASEPTDQRSNRRVEVGANWLTPASEAAASRCDASLPQAPEYRDVTIGFRCARSAPGSVLAEAFRGPWR